MNNLKFKHINAFITGGSRGIGFGIVKDIANHGGSICILNKNSELNKEIVDSLPILHDKQKHSGITYDLSLTLVESEFQNKLNELGLDKQPFNVFIHCAGIAQSKLLIKTNENDIQRVMNVNTISAMLLSKIFLKDMMRDKFGRIIFIGSVFGDMGYYGESIYSGSKSALLGFSKSIAKEMGKFNITSNVVSPGFIETDMTVHSPLLTDEARMTQLLSTIALKRLGTPQDISKTVSHIIESDYITGANIPVNGGIY